MSAACRGRGDAVERMFFAEIARIPLLTAREERCLAIAICRARRRAWSALYECYRRAQAFSATNGLQPPPAPRGEPRDWHAALSEHAGFGRSHSPVHECVERRLAELHRLQGALVAANQRLVLGAARQLRSDQLSLMERVQCGNLGLLRAAERFDVRRGYRFSTYAVWWVRRAIYRALLTHHPAVTLPVAFARARAQARTRTPPGWNDPIAYDAAAPLADHYQTGFMHLVGSPEAYPLGGVCESQADVDLQECRHDTLLDAADAGVLRSDVHTLLGRLQPRYALVVRLRFGIGVYRRYTLQQIADMLGITRERVRQIEARALERLRTDGAVRELRGLLAG